MAGVSWCPVPAYTMKATTDAIAGIHMATAMLAARINNIVRTWLEKIVSYDLRLTWNGYDANFTSSQVSYIQQFASERGFPMQRT